MKEFYLNLNLEDRTNVMVLRERLYMMNRRVMRRLGRLETWVKVVEMNERTSKRENSCWSHCGSGCYYIYYLPDIFQFQFRFGRSL